MKVSSQLSRGHSGAVQQWLIYLRVRDVLFRFGEAGRNATMMMRKPTSREDPASNLEPSIERYRGAATGAEGTLWLMSPPGSQNKVRGFNILLP